MPLGRFVCKSTELTKNEVALLINDGAVVVNDEVIINEADQVHENDQITLDGQRLKARSFRYILMDKPQNTICSNIDEIYPSLFNFLDIDKVFELYVTGRLDVDTIGLVFVTDVGRWSFNIRTPSKQCEKVYRVGLSRPIDEGVVCRFAEGVKLQGKLKLTLPAELEIINLNEVLLRIIEGKFHQVKRMFSAVGNKVVSLHREKIGHISLDVEVGKWRYLTLNEVNSFNN